MLRLTEVKLSLDHSESELKAAILARLGIAPDALVAYRVFRRAYDARKPSHIFFIYTLDVEVRDEAAVLQRHRGDRHIGPAPDTTYRHVTRARPDETRRPIVIGTGPCGLFAGLVLAQMGFKPIILERGKIVRERTRDTWSLWRQGRLNPESNVQFGEGGAGTFSDGKLYSQIKDPRHLGRKVLEEFVLAGAPEEILYVSKPHIGTFRLVKMVENLRATMLALGAEIRFQSKVEEVLIDTDATGRRQVRGVRLADGQVLESDHVVLAVGHSARDTFQMLHDQGVYMEAKPFSIGVRIEHPQTLIDKARFGRFAGHPLLGAADYKLVHHASNGRTAYSFCMCPGGQVVAATSEPGRVVTNGMSQYSRAERNANSGMVVDVSPETDFPGHPLAGIEFQRHWESKAFQAGGGDYRAPAQLLGDFLAGRPSTTLGSVLPSYQPGIHLTDLSLCLPDFVVEAIREALPAFGRQIRGYDMADALMTGVETRTSSPVRIKRKADDLQSINTRGLYPAGEGAGYAGGILSAGVDGIKVAEAVALSMNGLPPLPPSRKAD
ncbi:NAD(P)/FAD-dependent oxidoreductase [Azovibrio restrictus]|uniref:NAD(P)/FAD-dependent oxidoreductase n=1 Tax=Azovibrio restrictus TaxID=146938 RepID=UPI0026EA0DEF|nr:NAD(P)/FAD-dependent oxidoreductase [Azovibrio restrictus]